MENAITGRVVRRHGRDHPPARRLSAGADEAVKEKQNLKVLSLTRTKRSGGKGIKVLV